MPKKSYFLALYGHYNSDQGRNRVNNSQEKGEAAGWDERYRKGFYAGIIEPHDLVKKFWRLFPGPCVADIAMGIGRDALFLAEKGFRVTGLERSGEAISIAQRSMKEKDLSITIVKGDAANIPFKKESLHGVIVFYFLLREIAPDISGILKKGGILIYETFLKRQNMVDRQRNPEFLLDDGELLRLFPGLEPIFYEETVRTRDEKKRITARLVARKL